MHMTLRPCSREDDEYNVEIVHVYWARQQVLLSTPVRIVVQRHPHTIAERMDELDEAQEPEVSVIVGHEWCPHNGVSSRDSSYPRSDLEQEMYYIVCHSDDAPEPIHENELT